MLDLDLIYILRSVVRFVMRRLTSCKNLCDTIDTSLHRNGCSTRHFFSGTKLITSRTFVELIYIQRHRRTLIRSLFFYLELGFGFEIFFFRGVLFYLFHCFVFHCVVDVELKSKNRWLNNNMMIWMNLPQTTLSIK